MDHSQLNKSRDGLTNFKRFEEMLHKSKQGTERHNEPLQAVIENKLHQTALMESNNSKLERNRALLQYISTLANSNSNTDEFNYEFVQSLVEGGADINIADQYDQTIFHEVARSWNINVASYLLKHGCDINKKDVFGRTPLHVASAVNFSTMVEFLVQNNADIEARTFGDGQTPIHYASKNGAAQSLKMLLGFKANIDSLDSKNRTPLQLAAEWTRAKTAKVLIDEGATSYLLDTDGKSALCVLIERIPNLALEALNQLHTVDIITQRVFYYLQYLEASREKIETKSTRTPLETAVAARQYEVITHPVMKRLIHNKWIQYGRIATLFDIFFHVLFWLIWTSLTVGTPTEGKDLYSPQDIKWRVVLGCFVLLLTTCDIVLFIHGTYTFYKSQNDWQARRLQQLDDDMLYCHPRWPQERQYVEYEIKRVKSLPTLQAFEPWFYFECVTFLAIIITIIAHFMFYALDNSTNRYVYRHAISIVNLFVGLRILKYMRPFPGIGTLVILLGETVGDFINWAFLFLILLVPFAAAFWINFGPLSLHSVHGYHKSDELIYSVFRMAVGDEFNMEELVKADPIMSHILVSFCIIAFTIITLNLLIALLTDTFSRVYNNALANTIMQRAIKIFEAEQRLNKRYELKYRDHMKVNCSPEILPMSVDHNAFRIDEGSVTKELNANVRNVKKILDERFSKVYGKDRMSDLDSILSNMRSLHREQKTLSSDLTTIKTLLKQLKGETGKKHESIVKASRKTSESGSMSLMLGRLFSLNDNNDNKSGSKRRKRRPRRSLSSDRESRQRSEEPQRNESNDMVLSYSNPGHIAAAEDEISF